MNEDKLDKIIVLLEQLVANTAKKERKKREPTEADESYEKTLKRIIAFYNTYFQKSLKFGAKSNREPILARLKEGYLYDDFIKVMENKVDDQYFKEHPQYFLPATLFGNKMEKYKQCGKQKSNTAEAEDLFAGMQSSGSL